MPTAPHVSRTANFLLWFVIRIRCNYIDSISCVHRGAFVFSSYPPSFTTLGAKTSWLRHSGRMVLYKSLIQPFGELLKGHQIWSDNDITSNDLGKPSKHVTRFPLRGLVLEGFNVQDEAKAMLRSLRSRAATSWGAVGKKVHQRSEIRYSHHQLFGVAWLLQLQPFVGLGPMSKSPWIHCWRVLCVSRHGQRCNYVQFIGFQW